MTDGSGNAALAPQDVLSAAIEYTKRGWRVIPLHAIDAAGHCTCRLGERCGRNAGKHPIPKKWQDTPRLSVPDVMTTWETYPYANVGVATGAPSGFFVLDVDPDGGGFESMKALVAQHGPMPKTAMQRTGSGGYHYLFALPDFEVRNSQKRIGSLGEIPGIDIRGTGGQIVMAPSRSGKGLYGFRDAPILPAPAWLLDALRPAPEAPAAPAPAPAPATSPVTDPGERTRLDAYVQRVVAGELAKLKECREKGWDGPPWNATTHAVACNLVELSNSSWTGITPEHVDMMMREHAPRDERFGDYEIDKCVWSARQTVGTNGRAIPAAKPRVDVFANAIPAVLPAPQPGQAAPVPADVVRRSWDDLGNAQRVVDHLGDRVRYISKDRTWSVYDGRRWIHDATHLVVAMIQDLMANLHRIEAHIYSEDQPVDETGAPDPKGKTEKKQFLAWVSKQRMAARVDAAEKMARSRPQLQARPQDFDADPMLLNCRNGVVDLRAGSLLPHDPKLLLSQCTNVDFVPNTPAPRWEAFINRVMPDPHMRAYLQRAAGSSITGDTSDQAVFIHQGVGANGKSQFLVAMQNVLGDYNQIVPRSTVLAKSGEGIPTDIARMVGKRFLQISETAHGKRLDEEVIKSLTGGEAAVARHLYGKEFEFTPTGKIHYVTNHLPRLTDAESIWRRLHLFTWKVVIPEGERVRNLGALLASEEGSGILSWLVAGCLSWQQVGLGRPDTSQTELLAYRSDQDELGEFLDDYVIETAGARTSMDLVYRAYVQWTSQSGQGRNAMSRQMLSMAMRERGYVAYRTGRERGFSGVSVTFVAAPTGLGV